jgi:hypothetical protein
VLLPAHLENWGETFCGIDFEGKFFVLSSSCRRVCMVFRKMAEGSHMLYVYNVNKIVYRHSVELSRLATQYICKYFSSFLSLGGVVVKRVEFAAPSCVDVSYLSV